MVLGRDPWEGMGPRVGAKGPRRPHMKVQKYPFTVFRKFRWGEMVENGEVSLSSLNYIGRLANTITLKFRVVVWTDLDAENIARARVRGSPPTRASPGGEEGDQPGIISDRP